MMSDKVSLVVTVKDVVLATGLEISAGETGRLVGHAEDGRPIVQFPHQKRPWLMEHDEVRQRWPFAGLGLAVHYDPKSFARMYMTDNERGEIVGTSSKQRRTQALYVLAGELAKSLWVVSIWDREDGPELLTVHYTGMDTYERLVAILADFREEHGMQAAPHTPEWLP